MVASARRHCIGHRRGPRRCSLPRGGRLLGRPALAATALAALLLSGCGYQPAQQVRHGGQLVVAVAAEPRSLNPLTAGDVASVRAYAPLYPLLYSARPDLGLAPDLAAAPPQLDATGREWTVTLRSRAQWSDGAPITAADVVYTVSTEADPSLSGEATFDWSDLAKTEAVDAHTVRFTLRAPDASFGARLVTPVVPAHVLSKYKPAQMDSAFFDTTPSVSGGPFLYQQRDSNLHTITYVPNPHWYGGAPNVDRLVVQVVTDPRLLPPLLAQGQVLWAPELTADATRDAQQQSGVRLASYPDLGYVALQCNDRAGRPTGSVAVRQALAYAIDRNAVTRAALGDDATTQWGDVPPQSWAYDANAAQRYPRDVARARALLATAQVATPLQLDLLYPRGDTAREAAARSIATQAADAGLHITPRALDPVALRAALDAGEFTLALTQTGTSLDPDDSAALSSSAGRNWGGYASAEMDRLLAAERNAVAAPGLQLQAARKPLITAVQQQLTRDLPFIPLYAPLHHAAYNVTVNGLVAGAQLDQDRDSAMYGRWYLAA
ncbi:MAG TPA: ABC transporter substrate-binding protein [Candidatus Angelobacter sp.]|nr:ABC transporter substrate-binding protein [Candidatus Angelobacter sp.]